MYAVKDQDGSQVGPFMDEEYAELWAIKNGCPPEDVKIVPLFGPDDEYSPRFPVQSVG